MTWQPIETAPKDGQRILIFWGRYPDNISVVFWSSEFEEWMVTAVGIVRNGTHWMPLPEPPWAEIGKHCKILAKNPSKSNDPQK